MDKEEVIKKLKNYKLLLSKHIKFEEMILFGSHAKGLAGKDSDMDVAVIVDDLQGDYFSTRPLLWRLRRQIDDRIEPIILERQHDESGFLSEIKKYGIQI